MARSRKRVKKDEPVVEPVDEPVEQDHHVVDEDHENEDPEDEDHTEGTDEAWPQDKLDLYKGPNSEYFGVSSESLFKIPKRCMGFPYLNPDVHVSRESVELALSRPYNQYVDFILNSEHSLHNAIEKMRAELPSPKRCSLSLDRKFSIQPLSLNCAYKIAAELEAQIEAQIGDPSYDVITWVVNKIDTLKDYPGWYYTPEQHIKNPESLESYIIIHQRLIFEFNRIIGYELKDIREPHIDQFVKRLNLLRDECPQNVPRGDDITRAFNYCDLMETFNGEPLEDVDLTKLSHKELLNVACNFRQRLSVFRLKKALNKTDVKDLKTPMLTQKDIIKAYRDNR